MITGGGTGTNTGLNEFIYYQVPDDYFPEGEPIPLVIAYHGFGGSANSVGLLSTIDEECNTRGWLYLSVTGGDDQLFGSRICQANVDAAVQWMLANFNVDHDRIYMVGFSMGAGVTASFTARHRDPTGLMIAATGYVAGTYDLVAGYNTGTSGIQAWMVNPFNFGGPPASKLFAYLQASTMYHDPATYLPLPGTLLPELSMARNLHDVPAYFVWDALDTVTLVTPHNPVMVSFLQSLGATVDSNQVVSQGNPHHWSILDEADLFDFFTGKTVERYPSDFLALFDGDPNWQNPNTSDGYGRVSWCELYVRRANELARVEGSADTLTGHVTVDNVDNATSLVIHMDDAEIEGIWPVRVTVTNIDDEPISVALTGFDQVPSYLRDANTLALIEGVDSEPLSDTLIVSVDAFSTLDALVVADPFWAADLWSGPNPVDIGASLTLDIDAPNDGNNIFSYLIVSTGELLTDIYSGQSKITPSLVVPAVILFLPLDVNGDLSLTDSIPNDPGLQGVRLVMQGVQVDLGANLATVTNAWGLEIE